MGPGLRALPILWGVAPPGGREASPSLVACRSQDQGWSQHSGEEVWGQADRGAEHGSDIFTASVNQGGGGGDLPSLGLSVLFCDRVAGTTGALAGV